MVFRRIPLGYPAFGKTIQEVIWPASGSNNKKTETCSDADAVNRTRDASAILASNLDLSAMFQRKTKLLEALHQVPLK